MQCFFIWFSNKPLLFISEINRRRLIALRNASPINITLVTYKKLLHESALINLESFSKSTRITVIDLDELKDSHFLSIQQKNWQNILVNGAKKELELWSQNQSGNPAQASDLIRFCPSLLTPETFYLDFDIDLVNILAIIGALSSKENEFSFLLNYTMVGKVIKNCNNDVLYFSEKRLHLRDWIIELMVHKLQFPSLYKSKKKKPENLSPTETRLINKDPKFYYLSNTAPAVLLSNTINQDYVDLIIDSYGPTLVSGLLIKIINNYFRDPLLLIELKKNRYELVAKVINNHNDFSWITQGLWVSYLNSFSNDKAQLIIEKSRSIVEQSNLLFIKIKENFFTSDEKNFESLNYLNSSTLFLLKNAAYEFRGLLMPELADYLQQEQEPCFSIFIQQLLNKNSLSTYAGKKLSYLKIFSQQAEDFGLAHLSKNLADFFLNPVDNNKPYFIDELYRLAGLTELNREITVKNSDFEYQTRKEIYNELLLQVCLKGRLDLFHELLDKGADINHMDSGLYTPLIIACATARLDIVSELLIRGAHVDLPNSAGFTPLSAACQKNNIDIARQLIKYGVNVNLANRYETTPLCFACIMGYFDIAVILLEAKANVNHPMDNGTTPLYFACQNGHLNLVILLLHYGADTSIVINEFTAMHIACRNNHIDIVQLLIEKGLPLKQTKMSPITPLMLACELGHLEVVKRLLEHDADIEAVLSDGQNALHLACNEGHLAIVKLLLQARPELINSLTCESATPLMYACNSESTKKKREIFSILLSANANITLFTSLGKGKSSLDMALRNLNHAAIIELLAKANEQHLSLRTIISKKYHQLALEWAKQNQIKSNESNPNKLTFFSSINLESTQQNELDNLCRWVLEELSSIPSISPIN